MKLAIALLCLIVGINATRKGVDRNRLAKFGGKIPVHYKYNGRYLGKCNDDGLYYRDTENFVVCIHKQAFLQPCAPGSRNGEAKNFRFGDYYTYADFCEVNLVDYGYAAKHSRYIDLGANPHGSRGSSSGGYGQPQPQPKPRGYGEPEPHKPQGGYGSERPSRSQESGYGEPRPTYDDKLEKDNRAGPSYEPKGYESQGYGQPQENRGYGGEERQVERGYKKQSYKEYQQQQGYEKVEEKPAHRPPPPPPPVKRVPEPKRSGYGEADKVQSFSGKYFGYSDNKDRNAGYA